MNYSHRLASHEDPPYFSAGPLPRRANGQPLVDRSATDCLCC